MSKESIGMKKNKDRTTLTVQKIALEAADWLEEEAAELRRAALQRSDSNILDALLDAQGITTMTLGCYSWFRVEQAIDGYVLAQERRNRDVDVWWVNHMRKLRPVLQYNTKLPAKARRRFVGGIVNARRARTVDMDYTFMGSKKPEGKIDYRTDKHVGGTATGLTISEIMDDTPSDHLNSVIDNRLNSEGEGSYFEHDEYGGKSADCDTRTQLVQGLRAANWQEYRHPAIADGCRAYIARVPMDFRAWIVGGVPLDELHHNQKLAVHDPHNNKRLIPMINRPDLNRNESAFVVMITGFHEGREIVYTFHPGDPVVPHSINETDDLLTYNELIAEKTVRVSKWKKLGFTHARVNIAEFEKKGEEE